MSSDKKYKWKIGPGLAKKYECFMANHDANLATKSSKFKFESLDECLNNLYSMRTYLKGQYNNYNKRQRTEPTKLVPISFMEKINEKKTNTYLSKHFSTLVPALRWSINQLLGIWKRPLQKLRCFLLQQNFFDSWQMPGKMKIPGIQPYSRDNQNCTHDQNPR